MVGFSKKKKEEIDKKDLKNTFSSKKSNLTNQRKLSSHRSYSPTRREIFRAWHDKYVNRIRTYKQILDSFDDHHVHEKGDEVLRDIEPNDVFARIKKILEAEKIKK